MRNARIYAKVLVGIALVFLMGGLMFLHSSSDRRSSGLADSEPRNSRSPRIDPDSNPQSVAADHLSHPIDEILEDGRGRSPVSLPVAAQPGSLQQELKIHRVLSETWTGSKPVNGQPARQRIRVVKADFKYPMLRLEEDVTLDPKTGEEISEIRQSSVADHLMVGLREGVDPQDVRRFLVEQGFRIRSTEPGSYILVELPVFENAGDQADAIARLELYGEFINYAEQDWIVHTSVTPNDPAFTQDKVWNFDNPGTIAGTIYDADIDGPDGWDQQNDASSVVVAVTDTGVRYTHEDLASNMWDDGSGNPGWDAYDEDDDPMDTNGHGTHVAGIIGARGNNGVGTAGVAWNVQLMALRFIGPYGGTTSDAIRVINYARLHGANIINASWGGGGYSEGLADAIKACYAADMPFVAAAGNYSRDNDTIIHYPSGYHTPNVIAVASTDANDRLSFFSNYGQVFVDLAAPGGDIWSCGAASDSDYIHLSGTSMATPHVAGALALAKAHYPSDSFVDITVRLYNSVDTRPALSGKVATGGRLNLYRLLADSSPDYLHDNFDKPYWFFGSYGYWCYANGRMTREADEDSFSPDTGNQSLWFRWTAPNDGLVRFKGQGSAGDISVVAFEGTDRISLKRIADNFKKRPTKVSYLYFYAKAGRTYSFSVDSRLAVSQIVIGELVHHPVNDMWRDATDLGDTDRIELFTNNSGATAEPWESAKPHAGVGNGRSIWWKWTPSFSGDFVLSTQASAIDTVLAVYTGTNTSNLVEVASNDDRNVVDWASEVTFSAVAGTTYYIVVDSFRGSGSGDIVLNGYVPGSLFILKQPEDKLARITDKVQFNVAAAGQGLTYQWYFNGEPIPGAVQPHYTILRIVNEDFGDYQVRISDISTTIWSDVATLAELQISPQIIWQTRSRSVSIGSDVDLKVRATGTPPLFYQWFKDGVAIPTATTDQLTLTGVDETDAANYTVTVNNATGFTTSEIIDLKVFSSPWDGWNLIDPTAQSGSVWQVVHVDGQWVATSMATNDRVIRVSRSTDGENWDQSYINPEGSITNLYLPAVITKGNGFWLLAVDGGFFDVIYKSTDLINWTQHVAPFSSSNSINSSSKWTFHDGYFYLSVTNALYRTADGISWSLQQTALGQNIKGNVMTNGSNLVVVNGQNSYVLTNNAAAWQEVDIDPATTTTVGSSYFHDETFSVYLSTARFESTDGLTWTQSVSIPNPDVYKDASWVLQAGSSLFAYTSNGSKVYASTDGGQTWSTHQNMTPEGMSAAASDGSRMVFGTSLGNLIATDNLYTEVFPTRRFNDPITGVGYEGGYLIAQYQRTTMVSQCGERWSTYLNRDLSASTEVGPYATMPRKIGNEFWQVGDTGYNVPILSYYRGRIPGMARLQEVAGYPTDVLDDFCEGPLGILAIKITMQQSSGSMVVSTDQGASWSGVSVPGGAVSKYAQIKYIGGHYFYKAYFGNTYASTDLVNWTDLGLSTQEVFHQGEYWLFNGGTVRHSADLVSWSATESMAIPSIGSPLSYNGALVGLSNGFVCYSYDGINWVQMNIGFSAYYLAASPSICLVGGSAGQLAYTGSSSATSPSVNIMDPVENSSYLAGSVVPVLVEAYSPDQPGDPTVRLYYDGVLQDQRTSPPYEFKLPLGAAGTHHIHVECQNGSGPISLDNKVVYVSAPPALNQYSGLNGAKFLPGSVVRSKGVFFSRSTTQFQTSIDGIDWNQVTLPANVTVPSYFVEGADRVLAYSSGPSSTSAAVSLDGVNWIGVLLPASPDWRINYSHGYFWAVNCNHSPKGIMTSPDGINWLHRSFTIQPPSFRETAGNPFGTILGRTSTSALWRSTDGGRSWLQLTGFTYVQSLEYDGERFYINEGNGSLRRAGSSTDGINWVWSSQDTRNYTVRLVNGTAFTCDDTNKGYALSYDGLSWQAIHGVVFGDTITWGEDGFFYAKGVDPDVGGNALLRSHNGMDWSSWASWPTTEQVVMLSSEDGLFLSSSGGGLWFYQFGSGSWAQLFSTAPTEPRIWDFKKSGNVMVAINDGKSLIRSADGGRTWTTVYDPLSWPYAERLPYLSDSHTTILQLGGVWLSWSPGNRLVRSVDGQNFVDITASVEAANFKAIACNDSVFAAILADGSFKTSVDGLSWSVVAGAGSFPDDNALKLAPDGAGWRTVSYDSSAQNTLNLSSSADGITWSQIVFPGSQSSGTAILETTSFGTIAGRSSYKFSADEVSWVNANVNFSLRSYMDAFYKVQSGWLERSLDGLTWTKIRYFGTKFTRMNVADGSLYLFGDGSFAKYSLKDLSISEVQAVTSNYGVGAKLMVSFKLTNEGAESTGAGNVDMLVFLTADGFYGNDDDQPMGTALVSVPALNPGESTTLQVQAVIPNLIRPGQYCAGIWFNPSGLAEETNASNNFAISRLRHVGIPGFLLSANAVGNGVIAQDTGQRLFASGARVSLNASSGKGARFVGWAGDANGTESQVTILMDQNKNVQATFASQVTLQMFVRGNGAITGAADEGLFDQGDTALLDAVPASGWVFNEWSGAATGNSTSASILMDSPKAVTASFILPMQAWKDSQFTSSELLDPLISGDDVDLDGDGLTHWQEYLHGSDPKNRLSNGTVQNKLDGGYLSFIYTRLAGVEGNYSLNSEGSRNLSNWDGGILEERVVRVENGIETVEARIPVSGEPKGFIRFKYQQ